MEKRDTVDDPGIWDVFVDDPRASEFSECYRYARSLAETTGDFLREVPHCHGEHATYNESRELWRDRIAPGVRKIRNQLWPDDCLLERRLLKDISASEYAHIDSARMCVAYCEWIRDHGEIVWYKGMLCVLSPKYWNLEAHGVAHTKYSHDEVPFVFERVILHAISSRAKAKMDERKSWLCGIGFIVFFWLLSLSGCL